MATLSAHYRSLPPQEATLIEKDRAMKALKEAQNLAIELDGARQKSAEDAKDAARMESQMGALKARLEKQDLTFESQRGQIVSEAEQRVIELQGKLRTVMESKVMASKEMKRIERERDSVLAALESQKHLSAAVRSSADEIQEQRLHFAQVLNVPLSLLPHQPRLPVFPPPFDKL